MIRPPLADQLESRKREEITTLAFHRDTPSRNLHWSSARFRLALITGGPLPETTKSDICSGFTIDEIEKPPGRMSDEDASF